MPGQSISGMWMDTNTGTYIGPMSSGGRAMFRYCPSTDPQMMFFVKFCQVLSSFARLAWRALVQVNSQQDLLRVHEVRAVHRRIGHETHMFAHALRSLPASCRTNRPFLLQIWRARSDAYESLRRFLEGCKPFVWSERLCYRLKNVVRRVMTK